MNLKGAALILMLLGTVWTACAQQAQLSPVDLTRQNLDRVAASAGEIRAILGGDSGLLVALKRWVAKDASDHGQLVSDSDLTNDAIFGRLESDVEFRAVATRLLQAYGYLLPKVNPDSDAGREKQLVLVERSKLLAERQVEAWAQAASRGPQNGAPGDEEKLASCTSNEGEDCARGKLPSNSGGRNGRPIPETGPEPGNNRPEALPSDAPMETAPALLRAGASDWAEGGSFLPSQLADTYGQQNPLMNVSLGRQGTEDSLGGSALITRLGESLSPSGIPRVKSQNDGLLAAFGTAFGGEPPADLLNNPSGESLASGTGGNRPAGSLAGRKELARTEPVEMIRKANPYSWIPSLYDMYVQAVPHPDQPRRFGAEIFENGTSSAQNFPMDLPAGPDYVVGPGDSLSVDLWGGVSQRFSRVIDREGRISLPEVGPVLVSGKSLAAIQEELQKTLRTQFRDVSADVSLSRLRTVRVYQVGDVVNPGAYDISSLSTPLNALFAAGGPTTNGSLRIVNHYRGNQLVQAVDLYDLLLHGVKSNLARLENGDSVQVPPIGSRVTVEGMVRRPAVYELKDERSLADVLELAGGILPAATLRHVEVQRLEAHQKQTMLSVDIPEIDAAGEVAKSLQAFLIQDGDRVRIFPIAPYNPDAIYLEGHVVRPGRYSYRAGMRVTDLVASYKDLLPEPAGQYAEIIRLRAPDFHPSVESFDLALALANPAQAPVLQAMDTVRIFSRFDFENPPVVSVLGEVRRPGTFQTSGQVRLADAVHLAGGLASDAETEDAQVFRYLPNGKFKIFGVNLGSALAGDAVENILLEPRDRLLIHRNANALEPASVYVQGEIGKPGRYPLTTNMHIADLIRVAGGLKPGADSAAGDLTRYEWQGQTKLSGRNEVVALPAALAGDAAANALLKNGDVLTIRQLPGWEDLGASIVVKGEVQHSGTYGIRPGERLSSVLQRAGGFSPDAYPYGAILQRVQVREMELKSRDEILMRVNSAENDLRLLPDTDPRQRLAREVGIQQWQAARATLTANPPAGRVTIRISSRIERWKNSAADVEVRADDVLLIPKRPSTVMVTGQVFNPTAVSYRPGKSARWYLSQSGGPTAQANKRAIFVIRADGSVMAAKSNLWVGEALSAELQPGDTVVVPEKSLGGGPQYANLLLTAQVMSTIASTIFIALHY